MALLTQRLANAFPLWTRIRKDPSSFGQRLFVPFAEIFDKLSEENILLSEYYKVYAKMMGLGSINIADLIEEDWIVKDTSDESETISEYNYPLVHGHIDGISHEVTLAQDQADFFFGVADRITHIEDKEVISWLLWDSRSPDNYGEIYYKDPQVLNVKISNSTLYKVFKKHKGFNGEHSIYIEGEGPNFRKQHEMIPVMDDRCYQTKQLYTKLTKVVAHGFDGKVEVTLMNKHSSEKINKFIAGVSKDVEGPLYLKLVQRDKDGKSINYLQMYTVHYKNGMQYRNPDTEWGVEDNIEILCEQLLLKSNGSWYNPIDFCISPVDGRLYTLDVYGYINVHDISLSEFTAPEEQQTYTTNIDLEPLLNRVRYGEEMPVWTWFRTINENILSVSIKRVSPSGDTSYLQNDGSWATSNYSFEHQPNTKNPENSWQDIKFSTLFNEIGEWNFYTTTTLRYSNKTTMTHLGVYCEYNQALTSYNSGLRFDSTKDWDSIFFDRENNICIGDNLNYYTYKLCNDKYIAILAEQKLVFREDYDTVSVAYE